MRCIYIDNFRGFKETLLPLKDVNFFVGENSTGKTSVLSLIHLFHSGALWISGRFTDEDEGIDLGNYDDIVSMHATDKKFFNVGAMLSSKENGSGRYDAFLMTFSNVDGMPEMKRYTLVTRNKVVKVKFQKTRVMFKVEDAETFEINYENIKRMFLDLAYCHRKEERGFKEFKKIGEGRYNVAVLNSIITGMLRGGADVRRISRKIKYYSWPVLYQPLTWIAPIRTRPLGVYVKYGTPYSAEGHHTPYDIKKFLEYEDTAKEFMKFVHKFGKESGLFESVRIRRYGKTKTSPFELDIVLSGKQTNITNVGYGVSQILPIVVEIFSDPKGAAFEIQQPEIHLHPKAQAALADVFFNLAALENKQFMIETHSDFIIDRFRANYRKKKGGIKPSSQIVYYENTKKGNSLKLIDIEEDGSLSKEQPKGYREFFLKEDLRVLGY